MRIYVSGPMTGHPDLNRPAFDAAAKRLREEGHFVINPHDFTPIFGPSNELRRSFEELYLLLDDVAMDEIDKALTMRVSCLADSVIVAELAAVRSCDAIFLLRGWNDSRGSKMELEVALKHNLKILIEGEEQ